MPQSQPANSSQIDGLSSQFQRRWEPVYHWRSLCSMLQGLPGLRGAWSMSSIAHAQPEVRDLSANGNHLQAAAALANVTFGHDPTRVVPIAYFGGGANQYLFRADGGVGNWADILGTEAYIVAAQRGLTMGGWFWCDVIDANAEYLMAKHQVGGMASYAILRVPGAATIRFGINGMGAGDFVTSTATITAAGWYFLAGKFTPATTVRVYVNGVMASAATVTAAIVDTGVNFTIGADAVGAAATLLQGRASACFLCATAMRDAQIHALYHYTKAAYGVK